MTEEHVFDLLPAYALGGLDAGEQRQVEEHLQDCAQCRQELAGYRDAAAQMSFAVPRVEPPKRLKQAILEQVSPAAPARSPSIGDTLRGWLARTAPAWALATLVLLVGLFTSNLLLWQQVRRVSQPTQEFRVVQLAGTDQAPQASGVMVISPEGNAGTLIVDGLVDPGPGKQYQLWLIHEGQRTSGGVFSVDEQGYGTLVIQAPMPLVAYPEFGITVEPAGGSPGPTSPRIMGGSL